MFPVSLEDLKIIWEILGYILLTCLTAIAAIFRKKLKEKLADNIRILTLRKPLINERDVKTILDLFTKNDTKREDYLFHINKLLHKKDLPRINKIEKLLKKDINYIVSSLFESMDLRYHFSERLNKEFDSAVTRGRCGAQASRCFVYIHHHYKISMTHEDVEIGLRKLSSFRQNVLLSENGKSINFLRDVKAVMTKGVVEVDVIRDKCKERDKAWQLTGEREVIYLRRDELTPNTVPSLLMRESNTAHVLLAPLISRQVGLPFREFKDVGDEIDRTNRIVGVIGLDYIQKDVNLKKMFDQYAFILADIVETLHNFIEVELMHTDIKKRLDL